jgi:PIN domain nuclease of toxin-antitoxin system
VRLLLDTHVFIWCVEDSDRLRPFARETLASPENVVYVSAVSIWEIAIKQSLGKLEIQSTTGERLVESITACGFIELPVTAYHAARVATLPWHHADPFDRLLVAQAQYSDLTLVSDDEKIQRYEVQTLRMS